MSSCSEEIYVSKASREMTISNHGMTTIVDSLVVVNNGTTSVGSLDFGFNKMYAKGLISVQAKGPGDIPLSLERVVNETSSTQFMRCNLMEPIAGGDAYELQIDWLFSGLVSFDGTDYVFSFNAYPTIPMWTETCYSAIMFPSTAEFVDWPNETFTEIEIPGRTSLSSTQSPLESLNDMDISIKFNDPSQELISFESIRRQITITSSGQVISRDIYDITNLGPQINSITLAKPQNASPVLAFDNAGSIKDRLQIKTDSIVISPRYNLIQTNDSFNFMIEYLMPLENTIKRDEWPDNYQFTTDLAKTEDIIVRQYVVNVSLPKEVQIENLSSNPNSTIIQADGNEILQYDFGMLMPGQIKSLTMNYQYPIFLPSISPLGWIFSIEMILVGVGAAILMKRPMKMITKIPIEKIKRFVTLQDEKSALRFELEKKGEEIARGAISKHEYRRRRKSIEMRISELNRTLNTLKSELKTLDPRYDQMIRRLDKAEAELEGLRVSENQITTQYRSGRISKDVYESLSKDYGKRMEKARETVDSVIVTMREEAR
ncbi:hypothetical protein [[Eubacterium] cellulosolvens]